MRVSVVVPAYNRADLVGETIDSVLAQTLPDFELIVVDDGSTDHTPAVLARYNDPRLRVIRQANMGISGALNTGFRAARGEFAIMLGSDDRFRPACLARLVAEADRRPDAVLVYGRAQAIDLHGAPLPHITGAPEPYPGQTQLSALYGDFVSTITALIRRSALEQVGLCDETLRGNEDWDLWIRLAAVGPFVFVDEVLAEFRVHPQRFTAGRGERLEALLASRAQVLDKAFARPDLPPEVRAARPLIYRNLYVDMGLRALNARDARRAGRAFRQALRFGQPVATILRIVYLAVFYRLVDHAPAVQKVSDAVAGWKRRRRLRHSGTC